MDNFDQRNLIQICPPVTTNLSQIGMCNFLYEAFRESPRRDTLYRKLIRMKIKQKKKSCDIRSKKYEIEILTFNFFSISGIEESEIG
jgi:hypothetical protein